MKALMNKSKIKALAAAILLSVPAFAQEATSTEEKQTYFSNPLFIILLATILLLLAFIAVLGNTLQNITKSEFMMDRIRKMTDKTGKGSALGLVLLFSFLSQSVFAQGKVQEKWEIGGLDYWTFYLMIGVILCEVAVIAVLFVVMRNLLEEDKKSAEAAAAIVLTKPKEKTIMDVLNASVEIEKEGEIMLDHDYDGIKELDNNLPPWWKYGFYLTIIFAMVYLVHFHIAKTGDLQGDEYKKEVAKADAEIAEYLKNSKNNVDETNVATLTDPADLAAGKEIFTGICSTCHGKLGEGNSIGPNLTDDYWLHGGSIVDVFKTIKYGWPDKGMQSWKDTYSPMQIAQLASYVRSLHGTNPPNAKDKQGELYIEKAVSDSASVQPDSLKMAPVADSLAKPVVEKK